MDLFFWDADEELQSLIQREPTYEEIHEYLDAKMSGMEDIFIRSLKKGEKNATSTMVSDKRG